MSTHGNINPCVCKVIKAKAGIFLISRAGFYVIYNIYNPQTSILGEMGLYSMLP